MAAVKKKMDFIHVLGNVGLILHVPGIMAVISIIVCLVFQEYYSIIPFTVTALISFGIGQLLYQTCERHIQPTLWDSMAIAALSWLVCPLVSAIPCFWISYHRLQLGLQLESAQALIHPINALFEAMSGFTSTGLTLVRKPSEFSHALIWWRSFMQWVGGVGLIVFILSVTQASKNRYHLYYAEARSEVIGKTIQDTTRAIWGVYLLYTFCAIFLFIIAGMPIWEAINNGMTAIATGGFTSTDNSFAGYSIPIKLASVLIMFTGMVSFVVHVEIVKRGKFKDLWSSIPHRFIIFMFILGGVALALIDRYTFYEWAWVDSLFMWASAMSTTGFSVGNLAQHAPTLKIFLIFAMLVGGSAGSTSGGLKVQRFLNLVSGMTVRIRSIFEEKSTKNLKKYFSKKDKNGEEPELIVADPEQVRKLFAAGVLFFLWIITLFTAWMFITYHLPHYKAFDAFFEVVSAMSNVGLTTDIVNPSLNPICLSLFIALMWLGRVEIIPAIVLIISFIKVFRKTKKRRRKKQNESTTTDAN
ncbi:MAG: potassium transporter TrkG [Rhabdochlamydiaceae bacterium]|nr:potassium transporter TrkG [Candidatus Amphrikana amoebophyrae]